MNKNDCPLIVVNVTILVSKKEANSMRIDGVFQHASRHLAGLLKTVNDLKELNAVLSKRLDSSLANHYQVAFYRRGELVLTTDSMAWVTRMRYLIPDLVKKLRKEPLFSELETMVCRVDPNWVVLRKPSENNKTLAKPVLTDSTRSLLRKVAQSTSSLELKKALIHLARGNESLRDD